MKKLLFTETALHMAILAFTASLLFVETIVYGMAYRGTGDAWLNGLPLVKFTLDVLSGGQFPLWNPYVASGYNFLGDPMSPAFDWTMWLLIPFSQSKFWFFHLLSLRLYLILLGSGLWFYFGLRNLVKPLPALFGASAYMLSPAAMWFLTGMAQLHGLFYGAILFYLIMTEERRSHLRAFLLIALTVGVMFFAGQLAGCAFAWIAVLLVRLFMRGDEFPQRMIVFVSATVTGVVLAAARLWPMILAGFDSNRIHQDPLSFMQTPHPIFLVRSLVPDFLGWTSAGGLVAMPFEWANLGYVGVVAMAVILVAFFADGELFRRNLLLAGAFVFALLALPYTPFLYQFAIALFSPLVTGETLYFNFLFPTLGAFILAQCVNSLMSAKAANEAVRCAMFIAGGVFLLLFALLPYFTPVVSAGPASLIVKLVALFALTSYTFRLKDKMVRTGWLALAVLALGFLLFELVPVATWFVEQPSGAHAGQFIANGNLGLIALLLAVPAAWLAGKIGSNVWLQFGVPVALTALSLIIAAGSALNPYDVNEFPLVANFQLSSVLGVVRFALLAASALIILRLILNKKMPLQAGFYLLLFLQLSDLAGHGKNYVASMAMPFKVLEEVFPAKFQEMDRVNERFTSERNGLRGMLDNLPAWYRIRVAGGYLNFAPKSYVELASAALDQKFTNQFRILTLAPDSRFAELTASNDFIDPDMNLQRVNRERIERATVVFRSETIAQPAARITRLLDKAFPVKDAVVLETGPPLYFPEPAQKVEIVSDTYDRMEFRARVERPGVFLLRDSFDRGWSAEINGTPAEILKANHAFMALLLQPGDNVIKFKFWPRGFTTGIIVSCIAALLLAGFAVLGRLGARRR